MQHNCSQCRLLYGKRICKSPDGFIPKDCTTKQYEEAIQQANDIYIRNDIVRQFAAEAAKQEASCYGHPTEGVSCAIPIKPRVIEIIEFCRRMKYRKIGLAFCGGLVTESKVFGKMLLDNGFDVISVICKVGGTDKALIGLTDEEKICKFGHESMCNPIAQALIMNQEKTEFNILLGLCVGHDSLFLKYSDAMCTILATKDRLLGHNPLAAIYTSESYYRYINFQVKIPQKT